MKHTEIIADDWNKGSDTWYKKIYAAGTLDRFISNPMWAFPAEVQKMLTAAFPSFHNKRVLIPSSGDNGAVFAFHLLGAKVTSTDIAEKQLHNAKLIADAHGWDIDFIQDDSMMLEHIADGEYDLVYIQRCSCLDRQPRCYVSKFSSCLEAKWAIYCV